MSMRPSKKIEEKRELRKKETKIYDFSFTVETEDTFSEQEQQEISEQLLKELNGILFNRGYHLQNIRMINEWYQKEINKPMTKDTAILDTSQSEKE